MKIMGTFSALEHLIQIYFGQDYYEITGAIPARMCSGIPSGMRTAVGTTKASI